MKTNSIIKKIANTAMVIIAAIVFNTTANAQSSDLNEDAKAEVEKLNAQISKLVEKKDFASIVDMYADDATIIIPGGQKIQGRKAIADYWYSLTNLKTLKSEAINMGGTTKVIYEIGKWTVISNKNGSEQTTTSDIVIVWKRMQDYTYKIQLNSLNNPVSSISKEADTFKAEN